MIHRPCLECGALTQGASMHRECARVRAQRSERSRKRGTSRERGYGRDHAAARAALASMLPMPCGYGCGVILHPGSRWVAAHVVDGDPSYGWLASCITCNERAKRSRGVAGGGVATQRGGAPNPLAPVSHPYNTGKPS